MTEVTVNKTQVGDNIEIQQCDVWGHLVWIVNPPLPNSDGEETPLCAYIPTVDIPALCEALMKLVEEREETIIEK